MSPLQMDSSSCDIYQLSSLLCSLSEPSPRTVIFMIVLNWGGVSPSYHLGMYYFFSIYLLSHLSKSCYHLNLPFEYHYATIVILLSFELILYYCYLVIIMLPLLSCYHLNLFFIIVILLSLCYHGYRVIIWTFHLNTIMLSCYHLNLFFIIVILLSLRYHCYLVIIWIYSLLLLSCNHYATIVILLSLEPSIWTPLCYHCYLVIIWTYSLLLLSCYYYATMVIVLSFEPSI